MSSPGGRCSRSMDNSATIFLAMATLWGGQCLAQSAPPTPSDTDLSKEIENPVTRQITLPLRYEADFLDGPYKATKDTFELDQAVVPFRLNDDWALITRTKLPGEVQPPKKLNEFWAERAFQRIYHILSVAGAWAGALLGCRTGSLLSYGDEPGARR